MVGYIVGDALEYLQELPSESVDFIHLDDAWARPNRHGGMGVSYETHPFDTDAASLVEGEPGVDTGLTVVEFLKAAQTALRPGGYLAMDTDSYLVAQAMQYLQESWGEHCHFLYQVTLLSSDGTPDRSTPGMYASSGGYAIVVAQKRAAPLPRNHPLSDRHTRGCPCRRQHEDWGWGTVKPLDPYLDLVRNYTTDESRLVVPCAGTAPALVAAEREYGPEIDATAIDIEPDAKQAYERRREEELLRQSGIGEWGT